MKGPSEVRSWVMDAIVNDYEDLEAISQDVNRWAAEEGLEIGADEIRVALMGLMTAGLAEAYLFDSSGVPLRVAPTDWMSLKECFFLLTREGRALLEETN